MPILLKDSARAQASILYVEDDQVVRVAVQSLLEHEGWRVEACADGLDALRRIESEEVYDLFLLDNELPNVNGLELVRRARRLVHRQHTPVVMLTASECGREARCAGADSFLKKPDDIKSLVGSIARLLDASPRVL
ncbi:MAG TPA: response regulator [Pyrinomonadaceae bacterium]|jgi:chemosensory pili system protein ChpA (sensor histidine kinase/response regulator)|nr:response regulator [Pyrinomonadaceae bacterium]